MINLISPINLLWPARTFRRAVEAELCQTTMSYQASELWPQVKRAHALLPSANKRHGPGVRLLLEYGRWNLALYRTLLEQGVDKTEVLELIEKIQWRIMEPTSAHSFKLSRFKSSSLAERTRWTIETSFKVLFTDPFQRDVIESDKGAEFNVTRCPFAEYMSEQKVPELTTAAFCSLDAHMARQWGVEFQRSTTLATGGSHCDFKFFVSQG